jgi:dihydroorotase
MANGNAQNLLIRGGRLLDPKSATDRVCDLHLCAGRVQQIGPVGTLQSGEAQVLDAAGLWVAPGLVDIHVHLREPGEEYKEDIASGCAAAVFGGYTTVVAMPNTRPVIDCAELVHFVAQRGRDVGLCRVLPSAAVTVGQQGQKLAPFGELQRAGAVALTDDGLPVANAALMRAALDYARDFGLPVLTHAEEQDLSHGCHMHEGVVSTELGIRGAPRVAEDAAVARDILLARYTGGHLHVCHVSTAAAVDLIRQAKASGVEVTGEATPHHFSLTDEAVRGFVTAAKMSPPLREEADRLAVVEGLRDGTLDAIATDHAPHSSIEKDVAFCDAAHGVLGLQTAVPLALDLWRQKILTPLQLIERLSYGPCRALRLPHGSLSCGDVADVTLIDPHAPWVFSRDRIVSKSHNSPFIGRSLTGRVVCTIFEGRVVHQSPKPG